MHDSVYPQLHADPALLSDSCIPQASAVALVASGQHDAIDDNNDAPSESCTGGLGAISCIAPLYPAILSTPGSEANAGVGTAAPAHLCSKPSPQLS